MEATGGITQFIMLLSSCTSQSTSSGHQVLTTKYWQQRTGTKYLLPGNVHQILATKYWPPSTGQQVLFNKYWPPSTGKKVLATKTGQKVLILMFWPTSTGYLVLFVRVVTGCVGVPGVAERVCAARVSHGQATGLALLAQRLLEDPQALLVIPLTGVRLRRVAGLGQLQCPLRVFWKLLFPSMLTLSAISARAPWAISILAQGKIILYNLVMIVISFSGVIIAET